MKKSTISLFLFFLLSPILRADPSSGWMWHGTFPWGYSHAENAWWYMRAGTDGKFYAWKEGDREWYKFDETYKNWMPVSWSASDYIDAGNSYEDKALYDQALDSYQKALSIALGQYGENHATTATSYNKIGIVYGIKGESDLALANLLKSLEIRLKVYGGDHPDVAQSYHNIGIATYHSTNNKTLALSYLQQARAIRLKMLGADHPSTKITQEWIDYLQ